MKENTKYTLYLLAIFILYGIAGRMDYDDQVAAEQANKLNQNVAMTAQVRP